MDESDSCSPQQTCLKLRSRMAGVILKTAGLLWQMPNTIGVIEEGKKAPKKNMDVTLWGLWGRGVDTPLRPEVFTASGWPAVSTPVLRSLAGKPGVAAKALLELEGASTAGGLGCLCMPAGCTHWAACTA